jgi:hypothetical protein
VGRLVEIELTFRHNGKEYAIWMNVIVLLMTHLNRSFYSGLPSLTVKAETEIIQSLKDEGAGHMQFCGLFVQWVPDETGGIEGYYITPSLMTYSTVLHILATYCTAETEKDGYDTSYNSFTDKTFCKEFVEKLNKHLDGLSWKEYDEAMKWWERRFDLTITGKVEKTIEEL